MRGRYKAVVEYKYYIEYYFVLVCQFPADDWCAQLLTAMRNGAARCKRRMLQQLCPSVTLVICVIIHHHSLVPSSSILVLTIVTKLQHADHHHL